MGPHDPHHNFLPKHFHQKSECCLHNIKRSKGESVTHREMLGKSIVLSYLIFIKKCRTGSKIVFHVKNFTCENVKKQFFFTCKADRISSYVEYTWSNFTWSSISVCVSHTISLLGLNALHRTITRLSKQTEVPTCREKIRRPVLSRHLCARRGPTSTPHRSEPENSLRRQDWLLIL